jgi:FkbM family methyltransferase
LEYLKLIQILKKIIEKIFPAKKQLRLRYLYQKIFNHLDEEMLYVSKLLQNKRRFLDIGANLGIYSFHFNNIFKNTNAFEPLAEITYRLEALQSESLSIHNVALSNKKGKLEFYIPFLSGELMPSWASLEKRDAICEERIVDVATVDNYGFDDVDLIKIDVEGHEQFVIMGAVETIKRTKPILIVEIEQRHINKDINEVFETILNLNYNGFFLKNGTLMPLDSFSYKLNQMPFLQNVMAKEYVNNFIFTPNTNP